VATDDALREVRAAAQRRIEAERAWNAALDDLAASIRRAQEAGATVTDIARAVGVSRQRVYKLLERR
jgi:predicted transcriptional regulator